MSEKNYFTNFRKIGDHFMIDIEKVVILCYALILPFWVIFVIFYDEVARYIHISAMSA